MQTMLLLIAVLAVLSAAFILLGVTWRQRRELPAKIPDTTSFRPLFEPSKDELRQIERVTEAREIALREAKARAENRARIDAALSNWRRMTTAAAAAELLAVIAEFGDAKDFSRAAQEMIDKFRSDGFARVARREVAELLESHRLLLPISERSSGTLFWLKEEVAKLRSESRGDAAQKTN
ncbi:MAG: hypothetical protein ACJ73D_13395 [Pyrinomonadaceae bacterium]